MSNNQQKKLSIFALYLLGVSTIALSGTSAEAQTQGTERPTSAAETGELGDIVVTAQRRSENLQKVPISITVATAEELDGRGATDIQSLKIAATGVEVQANNGSAIPIIRGVGSSGVGAGIETPVAIYVDDVYLAAPQATLLNFNNIAQVEILKGPQGTLFGRNATAGLIQVTTRDPGDHFEGKASLSYGNYQTLRGDAYISGPLGKNISADLAVLGAGMGRGYGRNLLDGRDVNRVYHDIGLRSKWLLQLSDSTQAKIIVDYTDTYHSLNSARPPAGETYPAPYGPPFGGRPWDNDVDELPYVKVHGGGGSLRLDHDFGSVSLASITAYRENSYHGHWDSDFSRVRARVFDITEKDWQFSQEIQLASASSGLFTWLVGGYYFLANAIYPSTRTDLYGVAVGASPTASVGNGLTSAQGTDSIAGFGQATAAISSDLKVTGGLRYTSEKRSLDDFIAYNYVKGGTTQITSQEPQQESRFNKLTWRIALDYQISEELLGYISYNRGFKSGGYNPLTTTIPPYRPEVLDAYEAGFKSVLFDKRARFNSSVFYYKYDDVQLKTTSPTVVGLSGIYNASSAKMYGFEASLDAKVVRDLKIALGYQYVHGRYEAFPGSLIATPRAAGGYTRTTGDVSGNTTILTPTSTLNASATYTKRLGSSELTLNGAYYYNSGFFFEADNLIRQDAYSLVNVSARIRLDNGLSFTAWGRNLTDTAYATVDGVNALGTGTGVRRASYGPPRTYGITLGAEF